MIYFKLNMEQEAEMSLG